MIDADELRAALEDMVWQFGNRIGGKNGRRKALWTGGLSALEKAFAALGWNDPHYITDAESCCEVRGCHAWPTCVGAYPRSLAKGHTPKIDQGFGFLCSDHYRKWNGRDAEDAGDLGRLKA